MIHKFSTEPLDDFSIRERVYIDGQPIRCSGYVLVHNINEVPRVVMTIPAITKAKEECVDLEIANKEEIAKLMDKKEFEEFCEIWKRLHDETNNRKISIQNAEKRV